MNFTETLKLALSAVWAHKLRSTLTLLGMIIGVTAVVVIVSLIQGFNKYVDEKIAGIGAKSFSVFRFSFEDFKDTDTIAAAQRRNPVLTLEDFDYLRAHSTLVNKLGARVSNTARSIKYGSTSLEAVSISGATSNIADIENMDISDGRFFIEAENENTSRVAFVGADVASQLLPTSNIVGREISIGGLPFRVIGVAVAKGTIFGIPQDNFVIIPLKTFTNTYGGTNRRNPYYFIGTAIDDERFNEAVEEVRGLLRLRRHLAQSEKDNFGIRTPDAITGLRDRLFGTISIVAITVPSIALVIGGIVIMNIMLVSVVERTKEIGIRKALGARQIDILKQFLVEAVTLSAIGGAIGVLIAWLAGRILTAVFFTTYLSIVAIFVAVGVSGVIGILAGIIPAWKAARLDPIEALRAE